MGLSIDIQANIKRMIKCGKIDELQMMINPLLLFTPRSFASPVDIHLIVSGGL